MRILNWVHPKRTLWSGSSRAFFSFFNAVEHPPGYMLPLSFPFDQLANEVADNICQNGSEEGNEDI